MFKYWKLKVVNYLSNEDDNLTKDVFEWAGSRKEAITQRDYDEKVNEEDCSEDGDHMRFSRILYKLLVAKTCDKANRLVQNG